MLNKILLITIGIGMLSLVSPYTAPTYDSINFTLCSEYTAPTYDSINFTLGENDDCNTCTYSSGNWEIDCSDNCDITSNINIKNNNISITGYGTFTTSANITNWTKIHIEGDNSSSICHVKCINGGCFK